jgi:PhnB protein
MVSVTAYLCCDGAEDALEFYKVAFGAEELFRKTGDDGKIIHADVRFGDTVIFLSDEWVDKGIRSPRNLGGVSASFVIACEDADASYERAIEAGCRADRAVTDVGFGRMGWLWDPWGHHWALLTEDKQS